MKLVGFATRSRDNTALKLNISRDAFQEVKGYTSADGKEFVTLVISMHRLEEVMNGTRDATSICDVFD